MGEFLKLPLESKTIMIKKNLKVKIMLTILFITIFTILFYAINKNKNNQVQQVLNEQLKTIKTHFDLTTQYFENNTSSALDSLQNDKRVVSLFKKAQKASDEQKNLLRKELQQYLIPHYKRMKTKGVLQFHFVFPDNTSFLRMHKPEKFGDNLTNIRYTYNFVNKTKKPINGFENGKHSHGFRYVYPFFSNSDYLGLIEISFSSKVIQENLTNLNKIHSHFIVNKNIFEFSSWNDKNKISQYNHSIEHEDFLFTTDFIKNNHLLKKTELLIIKPLKIQIEQHITSKREFALYIPFEDTIKVVSFLPIKNIKDNKVKAYIVSYTNNNHIKSILNQISWMKIILSFTLGILFLFIYKQLVQGEYLKDEVRKKTKELADINNNLEQIVIEEIVKNREKEELLAKQSKQAALGEMMDAIAHQWKQPLGTIGLYIENLAVKIEFGQKVSDEEIQNTHIATHKQINHLISTIDEFREFFRPNQKQSLVNLKTMIVSTLELLKDELILNKIKIDILGDKKVEIFCIPNEFKHIFINLINNSKDAFNEHSIKNRKITFDIIKNNDEIIIKLSDNAGGIPKNVISNIFNSNFTTKKEGKGTGIGLYLTKQIIEKLNATIKVHNITNGVCFILNLPYIAKKY